MARKKQTILLFEDDTLLRDMYAKKFSMSGYVVDSPLSPENAVAYTEKTQPDLVLLDLLMPKANGFDILKALKANSKTKKIPVIIISNLGNNVTVQKGLWLGAENFLIKADVPPESVVQNVHDVLNGKATKQELDPHVIELFEHEQRHDTLA